MCIVSCSVMSNSLQPHGLGPARFLCPRNSPGRNTGVDSISFSRGASWPRDWTHLSCIAGGFFATEPSGKPISSSRHHKNDFLLNLFKLLKTFHPFLPPTPPPSHLATTNLSSVSTNLVYIPHIGTITWSLSFSVWLHFTYHDTLESARAVANSSISNFHMTE